MICYLNVASITTHSKTNCDKVTLSLFPSVVVGTSLVVISSVVGSTVLLGGCTEEDGSVVSVSVDGGSIEDGSEEDGSMEDGSVEDGSVEDRSVEDGFVEDGSVEDGSVEDGSVDDGSVVGEVSVVVVENRSVTSLW